MGLEGNSWNISMEAITWNLYIDGGQSRRDNTQKYYFKYYLIIDNSLSEIGMMLFMKRCPSKDEFHIYLKLFFLFHVFA